MADYCVTIAKLVKLTADLPGEAGLIEAFEEMGRGRSRCSGSRWTRSPLATSLARRASSSWTS